MFLDIDYILINNDKHREFGESDPVRSIAGTAELLDEDVRCCHAYVTNPEINNQTCIETLLCVKF